MTRALTKRVPFRIRLESIAGACIETRSYRCPVLGIVQEKWLAGALLMTKIRGPINLDQATAKLALDQATPTDQRPSTAEKSRTDHIAKRTPASKPRVQVYHLRDQTRALYR